MAQTVFRPNQVKLKPNDKYSLKLLKDYTPPPEEEETEEDAYTGPTAEDLRKEAEAFKTGWEIEKQHLIDQANQNADEIVKKAQDAAFQEVKKQTDQAQVIKNEAQKEAEQIIRRANEEAEQIIAKAHEQEEMARKDGFDQGFALGKGDGFTDGAKEVDRLTKRLHQVVESLMIRRDEILRDTEQQIVDIVILMTRKVVKMITEQSKEVVINNIQEALKKVRTRGNVTLRVNLEDLDLATEHKAEFIQNIENVQGITIIEDSSIDNGGCIVETDFGAIDARISSQLSELENKILEISPEKDVQESFKEN